MVRGFRNAGFVVLPILSGLAHAQSSVSFFGTIDLSITHVSSGGGGSRTQLASGQGYPSRFGFRGTEDLGGGLSAGFWLESEMYADTGAIQDPYFARRATVSLSGSLGEIRLGRDFAPSYLNNNSFDPFSNRGAAKGMSFSNFAATDRTSNGVTYFLPPNLGGFYGMVQYAFGEAVSNVPNDKQGNYVGARFGYNKGPINAAVAIGKYDQYIGASNAMPVAIGHGLRVSNVGASYDFDFLKLSGFYGREDIRGGPIGASVLDSMWMAVSIPVGSGLIRASVGKYDTKDSDNDWRKFGIGYSYFLSKRTQVYGVAAVLKNRKGSTHSIIPNNTPAIVPLAGRSSTGFDFGIQHNF